MQCQSLLTQYASRSISSQWLPTLPDGQTFDKLSELHRNQLSLFYIALCSLKNYCLHSKYEKYILGRFACEIKLICDDVNKKECIMHNYMHIHGPVYTIPINSTL